LFQYVSISLFRIIKQDAQYYGQSIANFIPDSVSIVRDILILCREIYLLNY
jgi:hypothetical protein